MTARQNSTQQKAIVKANNERWAESKNGVSIRVYEDGTVSYGDGTELNWADAHKLITDGRKHNQAVRREAAAAKKGARTTDKRAKLQAKLAGIVAALEAQGMTREEALATVTA